MIVMTGSLVATQYPKPGTQVLFDAKGLGSVTLDFT